MEMNIGDDILGCRDAIAIVSLPDQEATLVSRQFAVDHDHELSPEWKLFDPLGKVHLVSYERNLEKPLLFKGLMEIRKYYSLDGLNWCLLKYQGFSNFDLFIYNESIEEVCYLPPPPPPVIMPPPPAGNTDIVSQVQCPTTKNPQEANWICYPCFFTCRLSPNQASASQLTLPIHVSEYLRNGEVYNWLMRGSTGLQVDCRILGVPHRRYAKFGRGWRAFCTSHGLKAGDVLTFFLTSENFAIIDVLIHLKP